MDDTPLDNLYRGLAEGAALRAAAAADSADGAPDSGSLMHGHFAVFDTWTEIDSWFEGRFLERIAPGAFRKTMRENRDAVRVLYDHGYDPTIGDKVLGPIADLSEDDIGAAYEVPLLDTDYNRDQILPMLQGRTLDGGMHGSQLGASFRFRVTRDEWVREPKKSAANPEAIAERTIREVRLYEFGPVTFPAYAEATAAVRSLTDHYLERALARSGRAARAAARLGATAGNATVAPEDPPTVAPDLHPTGPSQSDRRRYAAARFYA